MTVWRRWWRFNGVGALGIGVQIVMLAGLVRLGVPYLLATPIAVGVVLIHNFTWHCHWTWPTRYESFGARAAGFLRFAAANGLVSLMGNSALMPLFISFFGWGVIAAHLATIAMCGLVTFWVTLRVVFYPPHRLREPSSLA